ncbi:MAG: TetR/AcrR family transcriptional regulator [Anaerolineae bacterium]|jgi:AcrR family transcriptional regulator|nr:TetR/AcrR family transcriptional regulator [Anaerolineae bacterium]
MNRKTSKNKMALSNADRYQLERKQQVENRRENIVEAAMGLFLQHGIENTTMQDIANAAQISKMTLYRYFPDRHAVAIAVATQNLHRVRACVLQHVKYDEDHNLLIQSVLTSLVDAFYELEDVYKFMAMFDNLYSVSYPTPEFQKQYISEIQLIFGHALDVLVADKNKQLEYAQLITMMNMIVSYLQRLALRGNLMSNEQMVPVELQLRLFRNLVNDMAENFSFERSGKQ